MDSLIANPRLPIRLIFKNEIGVMQEYVEIFSKKFDMYRVLNTDSLVYAQKFGYLEHMVRPTMPREEREAGFQYISESLQTKINYCINCEADGQSPYTCFDQTLTIREIDEIEDFKLLSKIYTLKVGEIQIEQVVSESQLPTPVCHFLVKGLTVIILYTATTSFIDGYDSHTGEHKVSIIPSILVKKARNSMFSFSNRKYKKKVIELNSILEESDEEQVDLSFGKPSENIEISLHSINLDSEDPSAEYKEVPVISTSYIEDDFRKHRIQIDKPRGYCASGCLVF